MVVQAMKQETFTDIEYSFRKKKTKREEFLEIVDGGESYYHFDATPRVGQTVSFCLITDEELDAYSAANKNSHNRDTSLYPETP